MFSRSTLFEPVTATSSTSGIGNHVAVTQMTGQPASPNRDGPLPCSDYAFRAAQAWTVLPGGDMQFRALIAQAIDAQERGATAYDQVIVGYLLQIAEELKTAGSAEAMALRRRMSHLVRSLKPQTLRRLVGRHYQRNREEWERRQAEMLKQRR